VEDAKKPDATDDLCGRLRKKILQLTRLCKIPNPTHEELSEMDALIVDLRKNGYTSKEIEEIVEGDRVQDTIRKKLSGVKVEDESVKNRMGALIRRMAIADVDIKDAEEMLKVKETILAPADVTIGDLTSLVEEAKKAGYDVKMIVDTYKGQKQSGLSFKDLSATLDHNKAMESLGITRTDLQQISAIAGKNNRDKSNVLNSVVAYDNLEAICLEIKKREEILDKLRMEIETTTVKKNKLDVELEHLQPVIGMCSDLMHKLHFNIASIRSIHRCAQKYGNPFAVIEAVDQYGTLQQIVESVEQSSQTKAQLDAEISQRRLTIRSLRGQEEALRSTVTGLVEPLIKEITRTYKESVSAITASLEDMLAHVQKAATEHGRRLETSQILADDLKFLKIAKTLLWIPQEAKKLPIEFAISLLNIAKNILIAKEDKSTIDFDDALLVPRDSVYRSEKADAVKLVQGAIRALEARRINSIGGEVA
jgi:hypothetical protein